MKSKKTGFGELLEAAEKLFSGSTYVDSDIVSSGNVLTAKPQAAKKFAEKIVGLLNLN